MKAAARMLSLQKIYKQAMVMLLALFCVFAFMLPSAHAASKLTTEQVGAVVSLLKAFNVDSETIGSVESVLNGTGEGNTENTPPSTSAMMYAPTSASSGDLKRPPLPTAAAACAQLERTLNKGDQGSDVESLQAYLQQTGDFTEASTTGYFGEKTQQALMAWQARMGVVASGDPSTTGFGVLGPRTRMLLMSHCKDVEMGSNAGSAATTSPVCVLRSSKERIAAGQSVTLSWESKNATYASSATGDPGPTAGSISVTPTVTTTYEKKVYGPNGEGSCIATVRVGDDGAPPAPEPQIVMMSPSVNVASVVVAIGAGLEVVWDSYLSLFGI